VSVEPLGDPHRLAAEWTALQARAEASFFLTWAWLGTLLDLVPTAHKPEVLCVDRGADRVAMALLWRTRQQRHRILRTRALHLNESGIPACDRVTIEHNGLLCLPGLESAALSAVVAHLQSRDGWDELELGGLAEHQHRRWQQAAATTRLHYREKWTKPYFQIDLDDLRGAGRTYLDMLSSNTRYQIRRAMRMHTHEGGELVCERAASLAQAQEWLQSLAVLHQTQWQARGEPGAFGSPFTREFHPRLVERAWPQGAVELLRIRAGDKALGYVYNFVRGDVVCNYQSGHVAEADAKLKAGLVCHTMAVEDALRRGMKVYDLLMGGAHFKVGLTNRHGVMSWSTLQMPRPSLRLENSLRRWRDRMRTPENATAQEAEPLAAEAGTAA
jgi:CelD/BcsL family acetyltransferase involved in cellulose biosynthesis